MLTVGASNREAPWIQRSDEQPLWFREGLVESFWWRGRARWGAAGGAERIGRRRRARGGGERERARGGGEREWARGCGVAGRS